MREVSVPVVVLCSTLAALGAILGTARTRGVRLTVLVDSRSRRSPGAHGGGDPCPAAGHPDPARSPIHVGAGI